MADAEESQPVLPADTQPQPIRFGLRFWEEHAGNMLTDPAVAVIEIIANAWDAGADRVDIQWPDENQRTLSVADNGSGMTRAQLQRRWSELHYDRRSELGTEVRPPKGNKIFSRKAYGQYGIGRHALFCFASSYTVATRCDNEETVVTLRKMAEGTVPFEFESWQVRSAPEGAHGTTLTAEVSPQNILPGATWISSVIASKFFVDPAFSVYVNAVPVAFEKVTQQGEHFVVDVEDLGWKIPVTRVRVDGAVAKDAAQKGIAWWTNKRAVGAPTWSTHLGSLIDLRKSIAKKVTYVVEADQLHNDVKPDWSGYRATQRFIAVERAIHEFVKRDILEMTEGDRRERKRDALIKSQPQLENLPMVSQEHIARFADQIQVACPNFSEHDLDSCVEILSKLEASRYKYGLLARLAALDPDDLDGLNEVLNEWTVDDAKKVLSELRMRLDLIKRLASVVADRTADELHELQPLFERGLWIFGPEFESIQFLSNRTLATALREFLGGGESTMPARRPDFVVLPNASLGVYSCDRFKDGEVDGLDRVVIIELKRAGISIDEEEKAQATRYARQLRRGGHVTASTRVTAHVLGSTVDSFVEGTALDNGIEVIPWTYSTLLQRAHARTFHLLRRVSMEKPVEPDDEVLRDLLYTRQQNLFDLTTRA